MTTPANNQSEVEKAIEELLKLDDDLGYGEHALLERKDLVPLISAVRADERAQAQADCEKRFRELAVFWEQESENKERQMCYRQTMRIALAELTRAIGAETDGK